MALAARFTPFRQDVVVFVVALCLVAGPLWAWTFHLGEPSYTYERVEVVVEDDHLTYADEWPSVDGPISDEIACSGGFDVRACAIEQHVAANNPVPANVYTNNPADGSLGIDESHRYAIVDDVLYETTYEVNRSYRSEHGMFGLELALEPADPEDALEAVSIDADRTDVLPAVVRDAATDGRGTAHEEVDVPQSPIRVGDDYYRVSLSERIGPSPWSQLAGALLTYLAPLFGLPILADFWERTEVTFTVAE